jgi:hypothetical protein
VRISASCPACGSPLDTYNGVDDDAAPCTGSWAICEQCAEVLRVVRADSGALTLRRTTLLERSGPEAPPNLEQALRIVLARLPRRH